MGGRYDRRERSYTSFGLKVIGLNGVSSSLSSGERIDGLSLQMKASRCLARERGSEETMIRQSNSAEGRMDEDCGMTSARALAVGSARAMFKRAMKVERREQKGYKEEKQGCGRV